MAILLSSAAIALASAPAHAETASVWDGVYGAAQAERGLEVYADRCADCHGPEMKGANDSPALADEGFGYVWDGRSVAELFDYTRTMMPVGAVGSVSDESMVDVIAAILQANGYPAGPEAAELAPDAAALTEIVILRAE